MCINVFPIICIYLLCVILILFYFCVACVFFFLLCMSTDCQHSRSFSILHVLLLQVSSTAFAFVYFILLIISVAAILVIGFIEVSLLCFFLTVRKKLEGPPDISRTSSLVDDMDFASEYIPLPMVTDASQWVHSASCIIHHEFKSFIHQCTYLRSSTHWMWPINYMASYTGSS